MRRPFRMSMGRGGLGVRGRPRWSIQAEARPLQTGRGVLSGAPDCACAGRRSATSGAGARAERPASLSMPLRGNEVNKSTVLKVSLEAPLAGAQCRVEPCPIQAELGKECASWLISQRTDTRAGVPRLRRTQLVRRQPYGLGTSYARCTFFNQMST